MKPYVAVLSLVLMPAAAMAQGVSVDDLIRDLRPRANAPTRGIRPVGPVIAPAPEPRSSPAVVHAPAVHPARATASAPTPAAAPAAQQADSGLASTSLQIEFPSGSDRLTPSAMRDLDKLAAALGTPEFAKFSFRIEGHTDTVGSAEANQALSARRAQAVVDYVASRSGLDRSRLEPVGLGSSELAVATGPNVPEQRNRRVRIVNLGS